MFYGVYYYNNCFSPYGVNVYMAGFYENLNDAVKRLREVIPNYKKNYKNAVSNNERVGWINQYEFGDIPYNGLNASQPHNSVNVIDNPNVNITDKQIRIMNN